MSLKLSPKGAKTWTVAEDWKVYPLTVKEQITVTKGFVTDLASIPRLLWRILPPFGQYTEASVTHDFLYKKGLYSRKTCDKIFRELMKRYAVKDWKIKVMYRAVRWFGSKHFNKVDYLTKKGKKII